MLIYIHNKIKTKISSIQLSDFVQIKWLKKKKKTDLKSEIKVGIIINYGII